MGSRPEPRKATASPCANAVRRSSTYCWTRPKRCCWNTALTKSDSIKLPNAGTSPASVYHFFPHKNAAFLALATRYQEAFREILSRPIDPDLIKQWQDLKAIIMDRSVEFFNRNPPAQKLYLGSGSNW